MQVTTVCPGVVRTGLTAGNRFRMPFIIDVGQAARSICDGLDGMIAHRDYPMISLDKDAARLLRGAPGHAVTASVTAVRALTPRPSLSLAM